MLPQSIQKMILDKLGIKNISSRDCAYIGSKLDVSETTAKRLFGFIGEAERNRIQHTSTMDRISQFLGYENYNSLLKNIGELDYSSEFTAVKSIEASNLDEGSQIQVRYDPSRVIVMTYIGDYYFLINESKNSKLIKGDRIRLTNLVLGQEMIVSEVIRNGKSLGGYRGAKDGGLTSLEIIV